METTTSRGDVLAEETHSGRLWSLIILPAFVGPFIAVALRPTGPARFALIPVAILGLGATAMVLSGFQYRFLLDGVEIRTLGIRLRSIPKQSILSYSIEPWAARAPTYGETRWFISRRLTAKFFWGTTIQSELFAIWIR
jgi:hypothetical protein